MLPYPNPHHFGFSQSQEPPHHPNPTGFFPSIMLPPAAHLDQHHYVVDHHHFFPGHGHHFNSETLEAVLRPPTRAAAAPEREAAAAVTAAPQPQGGGKRNGAAPAAGQGQGHARAARKRPFRTDRHSKIRTAQGVRDRRMRLSLDVARDFFALQDRLGFDKASKTVDWLLTQSKPAIERLAATDADPASQRSVTGGGGGGSDDAAAFSSPPTSGAADGSGKRGGVVAAENLVGSRNGGGRGSASMEMEEHGCELDRLVAAAPVLREYYYGLTAVGEMMSNDNDDGGDGDDDGEYEEEDGDFLDGMQY